MINVRGSPMSSFPVFQATQAVAFLRQRNDELEELMQQMDASQAEFDRISAILVDRQATLAAKRREFARIHKIRKARELGPIPARVDSRGCSDSAFNPEHRAWLKDKQSVIAELHQTIVQIETDTQLENEVDFLREESAVLQSRSVDLQKQIQRCFSQRRKLDEECHICRVQRKEARNQVSAYRKIAKDAEAARAGLLARKSAVEAASNPVSGLPSVITNLQRELDTIAGDIERLDEKMREYEDQTDGVKEPAAALSVRERERAAEWMQGMDEDLSAIQADIQTKKSDLKKSLKTIAKMSWRFSLFCLFSQARKKQGVSHESNVTELKINNLLRQLPKEEPSPDIRIRQQLETIAQDNTEFEEQIANLQRKLKQKVQRFVAEEARMRKQIHRHREEGSGTEKRIEIEIRDLKLKMAQESFK
jgi:chromosome segregation ATPase